MSNEDTEKERDGRRTFCRACIGGMTVLSGAMVAYPVATFIVRPPQHVGADKPAEVPLDRVTEGQAQYVELRGQQIIVLGTADGPVVLSASCPHLGCNVLWDTADGVFRCPCHGAVFDGKGAVIGGPVSAPLATLPFEIKDGKIIVS